MFTALLFEDDGWHLAQCLEIDLASQGNTEEEAFQNLKEAMLLQLSDPRAQDCQPFPEQVKTLLLASGKVKLRTWQSEP